MIWRARATPTKMMRVDDLEGAGDAYKDALPIYREIKDRLGEANTLRALGNYFSARGEDAAAVSSLNEALTIHLDIQAFLGVCADLGVFCRTRNRRKEFGIAIVLGEISAQIARMIQHQWNEALALEYQGGAFQGMENRDAAIAAKWLSLQIFNRIGPNKASKSLALFFRELEERMGAEAFADLVEELKQHAETTRRQAVLAIWQTHRNNPLVKEVLVRLPEKLTHGFER